MPGCDPLHISKPPRQRSTPPPPTRTDTDEGQNNPNTSDVNEDVQTAQDTTDLSLDFMPCPEPQNYCDDDDFKQIYMLISEDKFEGNNKEYVYC